MFSWFVSRSGRCAGNRVLEVLVSTQSAKALPPVRRVPASAGVDGKKKFLLVLPISDYNRLRVQARKAGYTMTRYIIEGLNPPVEQVNAHLIREVASQLNVLCRQVSGEATNINQIAYWANANSSFPEEADAIASALRRQRDELMKLAVQLLDLVSPSYDSEEGGAL